MEYAIMSEQLALEEYVSIKCLTKPLVNAVWQSNMYQNWITEPGSRNGGATASKSGKVNNYMANTLRKIFEITKIERAFKWLKECGL